mmetsp:Transcript_53236/g.159383  ORF Transcript_53236/g.159383 Transcript_53236/m.159383 type:complete len:366 (+) Transcript_53236:270-1367(+)
MCSTRTMHVQKGRPRLPAEDAPPNLDLRQRPVVRIAGPQSLLNARSLLDVPSLLLVHVLALDAVFHQWQSVHFDAADLMLNAHLIDANLAAEVAREDAERSVEVRRHGFGALGARWWHLDEHLAPRNLDAMGDVHRLGLGLRVGRRAARRGWRGDLNCGGGGDELLLLCGATRAVLLLRGKKTDHVLVPLRRGPRHFPTLGTGPDARVSYPSLGASAVLSLLGLFCQYRPHHVRLADSPFLVRFFRHVSLQSSNGDGVGGVFVNDIGRWIVAAHLGDDTARFTLDFEEIHPGEPRRSKLGGGVGRAGRDMMDISFGIMGKPDLALPLLGLLLLLPRLFRLQLRRSGVERPLELLDRPPPSAPRRM